jgi:hypothetical protein
MQNIEPFHTISVHVALPPRVLPVHVIPSGLVITSVLPPTAQNKPPPYVIAAQLDVQGIICWVHVIPSVDVAARVELGDRAQKIVPVPTIGFHESIPEAAISLLVQLIPSVDVPAV